MGIFDYVRCHYPLPAVGANALEFQTKDMPHAFLDNYEIRADGTLWREHYDIEDRRDPNAKPGTLAALAGLMARVNLRWEPEPYTGAMAFYAGLSGQWIEFVALFDHGVLKALVLKPE